MTQENFESGKLILLGCGKMGSAMLKGWLAKGVNPKNIWVDDPYPSAWVMGTGVNVNEELPSNPAFICIAIKPQMISQICLLYTSPSPRDLSTSRMPSSA